MYISYVSVEPAYVVNLDSLYDDEDDSSFLLLLSLFFLTLLRIVELKVRINCHQKNGKVFNNGGKNWFSVKHGYT